VTRRGGIRLNQLLDDLKDSSGYRKLEEEEIDRAVRELSLKESTAL
jgi:hypothetical protein